VTLDDQLIADIKAIAAAVKAAVPAMVQSRQPHLWPVFDHRRSDSWQIPLNSEPKSRCTHFKERGRHERLW
jgi:hypothetical protein